MNVNLDMKVLLLGATGLLGHNVLLRLMAEGHRVVVLVRNVGSLQVQRAGFEVKECRNIVDGEVLRSAAEGCEAVVNCAGVTDMSLLRREDYEEVNCRLPELLIDAMKAHGIRRLVHVSTVNTIGFKSPRFSVNEQEPMVWPFSESLYAQSKWKGEEVLRIGKRRYPELEYLILNPGFMLGPYDVKPSSGRMLLAAYRKRVMFAPKGGKAFVHVADVAGAVANALTQGSTEARYIVVNSNACLSIKELYQMQAQVCGYRQKVLTAPDWLLLAAGKVGDALRRVGVKTQVSTVNIRQLLVQEHYDNTLAKSELGLKETPIEDAIREFHDWRNNRH